MKKAVLALVLFLMLSLFCACENKSDEHAENTGSSGEESEAAASETSVPDTAPSGTDASGSVSAAEDSAAENGSEIENSEPYDVYPYDIEADKAAVDISDPDIVVGDNLYATQINDWYINFEDYDGKIVEIEGYYVDLGGYSFVGRKGPSCPYCSGGYVSFEFSTDEDLSALVSESSWIRVTGILREGAMYPGGGQDPYPFYYIEALRMEEMDAVGVDTVTN
ncbi:MAG TPA: hypothetical protein PKY19_04080 [Oscillospiraceae bacterium]|nr:hypothetical protein [Oscillospiraceae bacterium]